MEVHIHVGWPRQIKKGKDHSIDRTGTVAGHTVAKSIHTYVHVWKVIWVHLTDVVARYIFIRRNMQAHKYKMCVYVYLHSNVYCQCHHCYATASRVCANPDIFV